MFLRYFSIYYLVFTISIIGLISACNSGHKAEEIKDDPKKLTEAKNLLKKLNYEYGKFMNRETINDWNISSDLDQDLIYPTEDNIFKMSVDNADNSTFGNNIYQQLENFPWQNITDYNVRRQFKKFSKQLKLISTKKNYPEHDELINEMEKIYSTTKICNVEVKSRCELIDAQEMWNFMRTTNNPKELEHIWKSWHNTMGKKVKNKFTKYIKNSNKIARINNFKDMSEMWLDDYETDDFLEKIDSLFLEIQPLYTQLHAYIRRKLREKYGEKLVPKNGSIPAHLFGNIHSQSWAEIRHFTSPYPNQKFPNITNLMIQKNWDEKKIFQVAENFFTSIKLNPMPKLFWRNSILRKPKNQSMVCHAAAFDFFDSKDFRIKQCTKIDLKNLLIAYHEMGHVEYFIQYKNQPEIYRDGANAGFHEAVGDTISLSASTLNNFESIGLLKKHFVKYDYETMINYLYSVALEKIPFIQFAYLIDKWRYDVFQTKVTPEQYNCHWWNLSEKYRGIIPPVKRSEESFDPGAKYHIVADVEYMRYFVSHVIQFQFYKSLCIEAGEYDPVHMEKKPMSGCNFRGSKKAGKLLKSMMEMGSSRPWPDAMEKITGQRNMNASAILEYFMPLTEWLKNENADYEEFIGWEKNNDYCEEKSENSFTKLARGIFRFVSSYFM